MPGSGPPTPLLEPLFVTVLDKARIRSYKKPHQKPATGLVSSASSCANLFKQSINTMSSPNTDNEHTPLLGTDQGPSPSTSRSRKRTVMIAASALILACDFGFYLTAAPQTEIFQDIICRNYMATLGGSPDRIPPEVICKSEPVQSELALVNGWKETSDVLPGMNIAFSPSTLILRAKSNIN